MSAIRRRVLISGRVQGVAFRHYTTQEARRAGVAGWVRNLPDGRVEALFEGDADRVQQMVQWCRQGPPTSRVEDVHVIEELAQGDMTGFDVTFAR